MTSAPAARRTWRIILDDRRRDARRNLALDEALARTAGTRPTLRLWRNERCVVVGRSQLASAEVDVDACRDLGVPVLRRFTGGGAVYHDMGNLNVTVVLGRDDPRLAGRSDLSRVPGFYRLVLEPIAAAVGVLGAPVTATERDLQVEGAKLSGVAGWIGATALLVHATLLVDADLATLDRVLDGPGAPGDPRWERTRSRRMPVTSLASVLDGRWPASSGATEPNVVSEPSRSNGDVSPLGQAAAAAVAAAVTGGDMTPGRATDEELSMTRQLLATRYERPGWHLGGT